MVAIGKGGADIAEDEALAHVWGYAAGNDLTRRDLQAEAKAARRPWDMAKGFDGSAVVGALHPAAGRDPAGGIRCLVDGALRQDGGPGRHDLAGARDHRLPVAAGRACSRAT